MSFFSNMFKVTKPQPASPKKQQTASPKKQQPAPIKTTKIIAPPVNQPEPKTEKTTKAEDLKAKNSFYVSEIGSNSSTVETKESEARASFSSGSAVSGVSKISGFMSGGTATSRLSESTNGSAPKQQQTEMAPQITIRRSLFSDNKTELPDFVIPELPEEVLQNPHLSQRIQSYHLEDQEKYFLTKFFREKILCTQPNSLRYADMLIHQGVPTVEILERRYRRDAEFLLNIGFDEYDAQEVAEYFDTEKNTNQNGQALKSYDSNVSMLSCDSVALFGSATGTLLSGANIPASEISGLYYDASQCGLVAAQDQLKEAAADGNLLAQGFLMRMYAIGQGTIPRDFNKAQAISASVFSYLSEMVVKERDQTILMYGRYLMGMCYSEGLGAKQDDKEAILWYRLSADHGYAAAQAYLGTCYYDGTGVPQDHAEAVKWYKLAAEQGFASAQCNLGLCHEQGCGVAKSNIEAVKWYRLGANQGHSASRYNLGYCYEQGIGVEQNPEESVHLYTESALKGYSPAQYTLGTFYATGKYHLKKDLEKSFFWFQKCAEVGHLVGSYKLAGYYENGIKDVCEKNPETALIWYQKAAREGHTPSKIKMILLVQQLNKPQTMPLSPLTSMLSLTSSGENTMEKYDAMLNNLSGDHLCASPTEMSLATPPSGNGSPQTKSIAYSGSGFMDFMEGLEDIEMTPARALHELGICYEQGRGVEPDYEAALQWYTQSAEEQEEQGEGNAESQFRLGLHHEFGTNNMEKDICKALQWYRHAAYHGHAVANYKIGMCYEKGFANVEKNESFAIQFYVKAVQKGYAPAQHQLGLCYFHGTGVPKNAAEAVKLYTAAAEQGYAPAVNSLAFSHFHGIGVPQKNVKLAIKLYKIAGDSGYVVALTNLGFCYLNGVGVAKNDILAFKLFKIAAKQGYAVAQNNVGNCYFNGQGIEKNQNLALGWYKLAANQEYAIAQYNVGYCLEKGIGDRVNLKEAVAFYKAAAAKGNTKAVIALKKFPKTKVPRKKLILAKRRE
jgi:TPR repeat protein